MRILAEQALADRGRDDVRANMRYEATSNLLDSQFNAAVLCPHDREHLPDEIVRDALRTHAEVVEHGHARSSELFMDPRAFVRNNARDKPAPPGTAPYRLDRLEDIGAARALVRAHAEAVGLGEETVEDPTLAVSEVATNALLYGTTPGGCGAM
jgi:hypothetical protein